MSAVWHEFAAKTAAVAVGLLADGSPVTIDGAAWNTQLTLQGRQAIRMVCVRAGNGHKVGDIRRVLLRGSSISETGSTYRGSGGFLASTEQGPE